MAPDSEPQADNIFPRCVRAATTWSKMYLNGMHLFSRAQRLKRDHMTLSSVYFSRRHMRVWKMPAFQLKASQTQTLPVLWVRFPKIIN